MNDFENYLLEKARPKKVGGAEAEIEAMRYVYNNLVQLDSAARQRVVSHVMGILKNEPAHLAISNGTRETP